MNPDKKFIEISNLHKRSLQERGYQIVQQMFDGLNGSHLKTPRLRTYWKIKIKEKDYGFVKVNFGLGNSKKNQDFSDKEIWLTEYLSKSCQNQNKLKIPKIVDHWSNELGVFIVFEWYKIHDYGFLSCLPYPKRFHNFVIFTNILKEIEPPRWLDQDRYIRIDYARTNRYRLHSEKLSLFSIDFDGNIGILDDDSLVFFDFEHIQWAPRGLQETYLILKTMSESRRYFVEFFFKGSRIRNLWDETKKSMKKQDILQQAHYIYRKQLTKKDRLNFYMKTRLLISDWILCIL